MPENATELPHSYRLLIHQYRDYLSHRRYAKRTVKEYPDAIVRFLSYLQSTGLEDIRETGEKELQGYLVEASGQAVSTQRGRTALLKSFYKFLHRTGKVYFNPALSLEAPRLPKRLPRNILEEREVKAVLRQPDVTTFVGARDKAMMELMYSSGLRISEVCGLTLNGLDRQERQLRVTGKGGKEAYVPYGKEAAKALEHYLAFWRPGIKRKEAFVFLALWHPGDLSERYVRERVKFYAGKAGLAKRCTPHSFRHSCATHLLRNGADIRLIQELLRHSDLSSTQTYTRVDIRDLKEAQRKYHPREQRDA